MIHICIHKPPIVGCKNGLEPGQLQAIIWTNTGKLFIDPLETILSNFLIEINIFSFKKVHLEMPPGKW